MNVPNPLGLRLESVTASYGDSVAISDITLHADPGETVAVIGPSGCGKSTTLRAVAGLQSRDSGSVSIAGVDVSSRAPARRHVGYAPQSYALFPHMSVRGNVAYGLRARRIAASERDRRISRVLQLTSLEQYADRRPDQLSGGQRQRVALARALAVSPDVLLLDEPLAALDPQLRSGLRRELSTLLANTECATLLVTHDQREALTLGHRIALLRDGKVAQFGSASTLWDDPANPFVADFLSSSLLLDARVEDGFVTLFAGAWRVPRTVFREAMTAHGVVRVLFRSDALTVASQDERDADTFEASLVAREFLGDHARITVHAFDTDLSFHVTANTPVGQNIRVGVVPGMAKLLLPPA